MAAEDEMLVNNSSMTLTASTAETGANKHKPEEKANQKSSRNITQAKNKEERSGADSSEKSESDSQENSKTKRDRAEKEKTCMTWMRSLNKLESQLNMAAEKPQLEEVIPDFCSNKTCPISEHKIPKSQKVRKMAEKVILRKALFENNDERWYCLKCLKAHNASLFCFYCGQIYFVEETDLEDDGKAWICCDDCNKWVSIISSLFSKSLHP